MPVHANQRKIEEELDQEVIEAFNRTWNEMGLDEEAELLDEAEDAMSVLDLDEKFEQESSER